MTQHLVTEEQLNEVFLEETRVLDKLIQYHQIADAERLLTLLHKRNALRAIFDGRV